MNSKRENDYLIDFEEIVDELQEDDDDKYSIDADSCRYFGEKPAPLYLTEEQKKQHLEAMEMMKKPSVPMEEMLTKYSHFTLVHPQLMIEFDLDDLGNIESYISTSHDSDDAKVPETQEDVFGDYYKPSTDPSPMDVCEEIKREEERNRAMIYGDLNEAYDEYFEQRK